MRILLFFLMITGAIFGQNNLQQKTLSTSEAIEDFELYKRLLTEVHPGLYRYTSEEKMNFRIDSLGTTLKDSIQFFDFYKKIAWLNSSINCSHSHAIPTSDFGRFSERMVKSIPFYLIPIRGKFYVIFNGTTDESIKPGFEVTHINGQPISEIAKTIKEHFWTDGKIELGHNTALQGQLFRTFYYTLINSEERLHFQFIDLEGKIIEKEFQSVTTSTASKNYRKNPVNRDILKRYKTKKSDWKVTYPKDTPRTAIIAIPGFGGKKVYSDEQARLKMRNFMDDALSKIETKDIDNLIVELRYNSGGWDVMGTELLSYLLQEKDSVEFYGPAFTITNESEFLKYADLSEYDLANVKKELEPMPDGTFKLKSEYNLSHGWVKRKPNAFKGKVYILMDEYTASAAAEFCAIAKSNAIGTLVGQETNGTYGGMNGTSFVKLTLPHSKIEVQVPLVRGNNVVRPIQPLDRGVLPDYPVDLSIDDVLIRRDRQMEFVKNLIKEKESQN